ncbi:MAG: PAS domain-containing sensor histidine kinase [Chryseosolibacter sp.]
MQRLFSSLTPFSGAFLLSLIFFMEYYSGVSGSVGYVLATLMILWLSWNNRYVWWIGVFATAFIIAGHYMVNAGIEVPMAIPANRFLAVITIWLALIFAYHYRRLFENEEVQKRQMQALFENATEGMIFANDDGEIVRINPAAERMFGYGPGELLKEKIEVLIPDRLAKAHVGERKNLFRNPTHKPKGMGRELLAKRKDGTEFTAEISLSYFRDHQQVFYIAFIVDISERKKQENTILSNVNSIQKLNEALDAKVKQRTSELQATLDELEFSNSKLTIEIDQRKKIEERLIKSKQLYLAIAQNFPEGVIGILDRDMKYLLAEGQELRKIGFADASPIGQRLFHEDHLSITTNAEARIAKVFHGETVSFDVELNNNYYNIIAVPLPELQNEINEILVVMKNITDRKTIERKLVRTIEKEKELGALKSRFVTMASHEFRTPLSTMLSSVFLLQNYTGDKYEAQKKTHLDRIRRSIQSLTELMNDFLSIGQLEEGQVKTVLAPVQVNTFLKEALAELSSIRKPGQNITLEYSGDEVPVLTDRQGLSHILRNLISNAVKYSPAASSIFVKAAVSNGDLMISITDQGMGIPDQEQPEIFKRFYRAENVTNIQGTGLGLNIVKKYIKLLRGSIDFKSKLNEGTTFTVHIPVKVAIENEPVN